MNIFLSLNGTARILEAVPIYQGSNAVTEITVQSFMPNTTAMELFFILPDKSNTKLGPYVMRLVNSMPEDNKLNYWQWLLIGAVTAIPGTVNIIINAISGATPSQVFGTENTTSYNCAFNVEKGVLPSFPVFPPDQNQWALILQYMQQTFVAADAAESYAEESKSYSEKAASSARTAAESAASSSASAATAVAVSSNALAVANNSIEIANTALMNGDVAISKAESAVSIAKKAEGVANISNGIAVDAKQDAAEAVFWLTNVRNPVTGLVDNVQTVLDDIYNNLTMGVTAGEYDGLNLTASVYDGKNITAQDFDKKSRLILLPIGG